MKKLPKVGDLVKITYFGVITEVRGLPEYEPHFEIDDNCTRHSLDEISEMTIYGDDSPETALMRSFSRPSREFQENLKVVFVDNQPKYTEGELFYLKDVCVQYPLRKIGKSVYE